MNMGFGCVRSMLGDLNGPLMICNDSWMRKQAKRQEKKQKLIGDIKWVQAQEKSIDLTKSINIRLVIHGTLLRHREM